ncbi:MarR family transcriptional regulator [candidate division KSB1 bacterium]|nr:MarR family transcriptional regulator [candidate division KSB1 bacterium]
MSDQKQIVLAAMKAAGKPLRPGDIAEMTGIDSKEVSKLIKTLKDSGEVISPKRCFWAPAK